MSLPSWNDTPTIKAILDFMTAASNEASQDYIPPADRIAAFDNDGTLWVEQPAPAQTGLLVGKLIEKVKAELGNQLTETLDRPIDLNLFVVPSAQEKYVAVKE